jgi:hypothetical protein
VEVEKCGGAVGEAFRERTATTATATAASSEDESKLFTGDRRWIARAWCCRAARIAAVDDGGAQRR